MSVIRRLVEYKLWLNERGEKIVPTFIKDGGYYLKEDGTMVGILEAEHDVYVPDAFTDLSENDLTIRISALRETEVISGAPDFLYPQPRISVEDEVKFVMGKVVS